MRRVFLSICALALGTPAHAQVMGRVSIESDYRHRGYSATDGEPAVTGALSYDDQSGVYANGLVILSTDGSDGGVSGFEANLGYAARVSGTVSVETGLARTQYARMPGDALDLRYTEVYGGIAAGRLAARLYYSPDYLGKDRHTLYAELQASVGLRRDWNLGLHFGTLTYLSDPPRYTERSRYDWRATISHSIGDVELYASLSGRGPGSDYYARSRGRAVATAGAALAF